ncbi:MAG TPA: hypothetical protein VGM44_12860 [Polyangiaceae bacterium]
MASIARTLTALVSFASATIILTGVASAQAPASAAFPPQSNDQPPPTPPPTPAPSPPTQPAPVTQPAPAAAPPPAYPQQNQIGDPVPPPATGYANAPPGYGYGYPPPPPPHNPDEGFKVPEFSIRIDPFNWLLEGRLGLELETQVYKFVSVEFVPVFVTTHSPPVLNYDSYSSTLTQSSHGIGAISGIGIDAAFWFDGKPFRGYALRTGFTNYAYTYNTTDSGIAVDSVSHTDREFFVMLADASRWGAFTIGGGIGLGYELNRENRCFTGAFDVNSATSNCPKDQMLIQLDNQGNRADLNGFLYPFDLLVRFSLGVVL